MRALFVIIACLIAANSHAKILIVQPGIIDDAEAAVLASLKAALGSHAHVVRSGWVLDPAAQAKAEKADVWMQVWFEKPQGQHAVWARVQHVGAAAGWVVRLDDLSDPKKTGAALAKQVQRGSNDVQARTKTHVRARLSPRRQAVDRRDGISVNINTAGVFVFDWYAVNAGVLLAGYHYVGGEVSLQQRDAPTVGAEGRNLTVQGTYRLHVRGRQDSFFLYLSPTLIDAQGTQDDPDDGLGTVDHQEFTVFAGIGARWFWTVGLNITARLGLPLTGLDDPDTPETAVMGGINLVDGELSIGWVF